MIHLGNEINREWIKYIDLSLIDIYPIQFANCDRLKLNDRVYIFNNHYSKFKDSKEYGLVIVDEAHLFLNTESLRYKYLVKNIKAQKIIFLTATPIKDDRYDFYTYVDIATQVLNKKDLDKSWIDKICTENKNEDEIICSTFDINTPVTRYFKDTIMSLNVEGFKKTQARRLLPQIWEYNSPAHKKQHMLDMINKRYQENANNKFVIFTRYVDKEAKEIGKYLEQDGYVEYSYGVHNQKSYYVVTGSNAHELSKFSGRDNLPTVLILTYQIAEQGVNLPGFNYVVNFHISSFPSALEQRFGRIDRMGKAGSVFGEINMCYMISRKTWDINTANFFVAVGTYMHELLSYLPSKNTILSEEIINRYHQTQALMQDYIEKLRSMCKDTNEINDVIEYYLKEKECTELLANREEQGNGQFNIEVGLGEDGKNELLKFCYDRNIVFDTELSIDEAKEKLLEDIREELTQIKTQLLIATLEAI